MSFLRRSVFEVYPRNELIAAVTGTRVTVLALKALDLTINLVYFWTDSPTDLKWISSVADNHKKLCRKPY